MKFLTTKVKFRGEVTSLSKSADTVLREIGYDYAGVRGPVWWCLDDKTLNELRNQIEY